VNANLIARDFEVGTLVALRHQVQKCALANGLDGLALYRFVVAVNEITTNAVRHGGGHGHLSLWRVGDQLHCSVSDEGSGLAGGYHPRRPRPDLPGGRGLWLAHQSSDDFTVRTSTEGTTVTLAMSTLTAAG
jgi:anti-sigma regulatory factor (Ser/Thr protein kinase)